MNLCRRRSHAAKQTNNGEEQLLHRWQKQLRAKKCEAVGGPLLELLRSASVDRRSASMRRVDVRAT